MTILHKAGIYGLLAVGLSVSIYLGYNHYQGLLGQIGTLQQDNATLHTSFAVEKETVTQLEELVTEWQIAAEAAELRAQALQESTEAARAELRRLNDIFSRHDFTLLARAKPGLIERRINDGTDRVFSVFVCETTTPGRCDSNGRTIAEDEGNTSEP